MAATSLLALLDDIATLLDDIAVMTKVAARQGVAATDDVAAMTQLAAKKTAGVLGDDLALNAEQVSGVRASRELPVVWAVAKGSFINKAILVPAALLISFVAPWAITPLLMLGGLFLCFEGVEKLLHAFSATTKNSEAQRAARMHALLDSEMNLVELEQKKIKGAVRTDFILSAEIIVITLGTLTTASMGQRVAVLVVVAVLITIAVYGLVAGIVKLDDAGLYLKQQSANWQQASGRLILAAAPLIMKSLSVLGTAAMFLVGGGILAHGIPAIGHSIEEFSAHLGWLAPVSTAVAGGIIGLLAGAIAVFAVTVAGKLKSGTAN